MGGGWGGGGCVVFFFQAEDGIRGYDVTGVQTCALPILGLYHGQNNAKFFRRLLSGKTVELSHLDKWLEFTKK